MVRIVGGTNELVSLVGYSISRTLALSKTQKFVKSRYFTETKCRNIEVRNRGFGNLEQILPVVWDLLSNFASTRLGLRWTFSAPISGS
jgi:hypothetical protein